MPLTVSNYVMRRKKGQIHTRECPKLRNKGVNNKDVKRDRLVSLTVSNYVVET
ncbi:hypothetical protein PG2022B_1831 [Bifidobacterium animalis subsp. animalis]|nr:hypothetical protein PG2022B_1831 [Bifidobacterium animalis subsp. animalis]